MINIGLKGGNNTADGVQGVIFYMLQIPQTFQWLLILFLWSSKRIVHLRHFLKDVVECDKILG